MARQVAEQNSMHYHSSESNSGLWLGAAIGEMALQGRDKLTFLVSPPIESFGLWVEQLIAESTGKHGRGILPVADEPVGEPSVYGDDRVFAYLRDSENPDERLEQAVKELAEAGHPTVTLATKGPTDLGRIFFLAEFAVAVAGWALEINPFDQPNVQEAKDNTKRVLDSGSVPELAPADDEALRALLSDAGPPHYVAINGLRAPVGRLRRGGVGAPRGDPGGRWAGDDLRLRASLFALHRPAAQGRPSHRPVSAVRQRPRARRRNPRRRLFVRQVDRRAGGG